MWLWQLLYIGLKVYFAASMLVLAGILLVRSNDAILAIKKRSRFTGF